MLKARTCILLGAFRVNRQDVMITSRGWRSAQWINGSSAPRSGVLRRGWWQTGRRRGQRWARWLLLTFVFFCFQFSLAHLCVLLRRCMVPLQGGFLSGADLSAGSSPQDHRCAVFLAGNLWKQTCTCRRDPERMTPLCHLLRAKMTII